MKDPEHWLFRLTPDEWIAAALAELRRAEDAYKTSDVRAGHAGARRAAGMALNGALIVEPDERWGRSYMDHLNALGRPPAAAPQGPPEGQQLGGAAALPVPEAVREAARLLLETPGPGGGVISLRSRAGDERFLEAARTIMAHAYAVVARYAGEGAAS
jgi:hypothetical protein